MILYDTRDILKQNPLFYHVLEDDWSGLFLVLCCGLLEVGFFFLWGPLQASEIHSYILLQNLVRKSAANHAHIGKQSKTKLSTVSTQSLS